MVGGEGGRFVGLGLKDCTEAVSDEGGVAAEQRRVPLIFDAGHRRFRGGHSRDHRPSRGAGVAFTHGELLPPLLPCGASARELVVAAHHGS